MSLAGHDQEVEILLCQVEEPFFLELTHKLGRAWPMVAIPTFMAALRIVQ
jgi:hypothetical protein|nr:hypothetical protein [Thermomonas mangrovi]